MLVESHFGVSRCLVHDGWHAGQRIGPPHQPSQLHSSGALDDGCRKRKTTARGQGRGVQVAVPSNPLLWSRVLDYDRKNETASASCRDALPPSDHWCHATGPDQQRQDQGSHQHRAATPLGGEVTASVVRSRSEDAAWASHQENRRREPTSRTTGWTTTSQMDGRHERAMQTCPSEPERRTGTGTGSARVDQNGLEPYTATQRSQCTDKAVLI